MIRVVLAGLAVLVGTVRLSAGAENASPTGTWLISQRIALNISYCEGALCGQIVWLRNLNLRTPGMCGRTIVWGLTPTGPSQWSGGSFFDPEDGATYKVSAHEVSAGEISARIFKGVPMFGRTETLTRIDPHSLPGWCEAKSGR